MAQWSDPEPEHNWSNEDVNLFGAEMECPCADDSQVARDTAYLRSVNAFWCPLCQSGFQRIVIATMTLPYDDWQYQCDNPECRMIGTRTEIEIMAAPVEMMFGELCLAE